jgi:hypothetical protein
VLLSYFWLLLFLCVPNEFENVPGVSVLPFGWLVGGVGLHGDVLTEFSFEIVLLGMVVAVGAVVGSSPIQVHDVPGDEPRIDALVFFQNGLGFDFLNGNRVIGLYFCKTSFFVSK